MTRKSLSNFLLLISGSTTTVPVSLSFNILTKDLPSLPSKTSSTLLAKVNLEKGLYSNDVIVCFLKGNISLSRSLSRK